MQDLIGHRVALHLTHQGDVLSLDTLLVQRENRAAALQAGHGRPKFGRVQLECFGGAVIAVNDRGQTTSGATAAVGILAGGAAGVDVQINETHGTTPKINGPDI